MQIDNSKNNSEGKQESIIGFVDLEHSDPANQV